jgi:hypothetical protein
LGIFTHTFLGFTGGLDDDEEERLLHTGKRFVKDPSIKLMHDSTQVKSAIKIATSPLNPID